MLNAFESTLKYIAKHKYEKKTEGDFSCTCTFMSVCRLEDIFEMPSHFPFVSYLKKFHKKVSDDF